MNLEFILEIVNPNTNRTGIVCKRKYKMEGNIIGGHEENVFDDITHNVHEAMQLIKDDVNNYNTNYLRVANQKFSPEKRDKVNKQMEDNFGEHLKLSIEHKGNIIAHAVMDLNHVAPHVRYKVNVKPYAQDMIKILKKKREKISWDKINQE